MDKRKLIEAFVQKLSADLAVLTQAAIAAHEGATHAESKSEDPYDTRGLEASYLAGAQSKRAMEIENQLNLFRFIDVKKFDATTPLAATALIELACEGRKSLMFLMPKGGGLTVTFEGRTVQVLTPQSPLGEAILGRRVGDELEVEINGTERDYEIVGVW